MLKNGTRSSPRASSSRTSRRPLARVEHSPFPSPLAATRRPCVPLSHFDLNVELTPVTYYDRATQIPSATTSTVTIFPRDKPVSYATRTTLQTSAPASTTRRRLNTSLTAEADGFMTG